MSALTKSARRGLLLSKHFHTGRSAAAKNLPNPWVLATSKELWEALEHKKGNTDPFLMVPQKRGPGTRDCPNVVLSPYDKRVVGCICDDEVMHIKWFWLHEHCPRRCYCNYWFVLEKFEMPNYYQDTCPPCP